MRSCWLHKIWARDLLGLFPKRNVLSLNLKKKSTIWCKFGMNLFKWFGTKIPQPTPGFSWLVVLAGFPILGGEVRKSVQFRFPTCEPRESVVNWIACKQDDEFPRHSGQISKQKIFVPTLANCHLDSQRLTKFQEGSEAVEKVHSSEKEEEIHYCVESRRAAFASFAMSDLWISEWSYIICASSVSAGQPITTGL